MPSDPTIPQHELIGRAPQVQRLTAALARTAGGSGRTLLLHGSAGIGKSRVAQELLTIASQRGHLVLSARAYVLEQHLDYAPVIGSLGHYIRHLQPAQQAEWITDLPHLRRLLDGPAEAADLRKGDLLDSVARLVERIARRQPLLWFIDDLHWADRATVELLYHIARSIRDQRVLLLGAYRSPDPDASGQFDLPVQAMVRAGLADVVALERLEPKHVSAMVGSRLGARPSRSLLDHLEARSKGSPFLVETLLSSLSDQGLLIRAGGAVSLRPAAAPRPVQAGREIILDRLARLGHDERQVLDILAVMGGDAGQNDLCRAIGTDQLALVATLWQLQQAGLISEAASDAESSVWVSLTHPLFQEVLYDELPPDLRRRYHAQVAAALEQRSPLPVGRLLRHYEGSGGGSDPERALRFLLAAAERAAAGPGQSASHYYRAAVAVVRDGLHPELLPTVLLGLSRSLAKAGELAAARDCLLEGLEAAGQSGDAQVVARLHIEAAYVCMALGDVEAAGASIDAGIAKLAGSGWSPESVTLRGQRCTLDLVLGDTGGVSRHATDLAEAVEALQTPAARAWHCHARLWAELLAGQPANGVALAAECLEQAWLSQEPPLVTMATADRALTLLHRGEHRPAAAEVNATLAHLPGANVAQATQILSPLLIMAETLAGNWEAALQVSDESAPLEPWLPAWPRANLGARAIVLIRRGDLEQARACLKEARPASLTVVTDFEYADALLALEGGDYQRAAELAAGLYAWGLSPIGIALLAEAQALLGDVQAVRNIASLFSFASSPELPLVCALGAWVEGLAGRTAGEAAAAMEAFARAAGEFGQLAMPFDAARARFEQAKLLAAADARGAIALARRSLQAFAHLGANLWVERVRAWLAGQVRRPPVAERKPEALLAYKPDAAFSHRELEIIRLLDEGLTNVAIAERLVISRRTVGNHLERMFTRHDVNNRLALVRFARESGLV